MVTRKEVFTEETLRAVGRSLLIILLWQISLLINLRKVWSLGVKGVCLTRCATPLGVADVFMNENVSCAAQKPA